MWYLFPLLVVALLVAGAWLNRTDGTKSVCIQVGTRVVRVDRLPEVRSGSLSVVPCTPPVVSKP